MSMVYPHPGYGRKAEQLDDEEDAQSSLFGRR
jgi:hypothetical protein